VLIASTSLSNVGQLKPDNPRLWLAAVAGLVALAAIGCVVGFALRVLVSEPTTLDDLVREEAEPLLLEQQAADVRYVRRHPELLPDDCQTIRQVQDKYNEAQSEALKDYYEFYIFQLLAAVRYDNVYRRFKVATRVMFACATIAATAIVILVWAANPPSPPDTQSLSPSAAPIQKQKR
jgi:hypothetical protein